MARRPFQAPTPASPLFAPAPYPLARPLPLIPLGLGDLAYTLWYTREHAVPGYLLLLSLLRCIVLAGILQSVRWRARGGWLLGSVGATLCACTWTICYQTMWKNWNGGDGEDGDGGGGGGGGGGVIEVEVAFLAITAAIAMFEYLFYLLLVRLVPARLFALRGPPPLRSPSLSALSPSLTPVPGPGRRRSRTSRHGSGSGADWTLHPGKGILRSPVDTDDEDEHGHDGHAEGREGLSPVSPRYSQGHGHGHGKRPSVGRDPTSPRIAEDDEAEEHRPQGEDDYAALGLGQPDVEAGYRYSPRYNYRNYYGDYDNGYGDDDGYGYASDSASSISESSIIDLPPATLAPLELDSLVGGVAAGVAGVGAAAGAAAGAAVEIASGAGDLVRRSASARFLGRSWASGEEHIQNAGQSGQGQRESLGVDGSAGSRGYGTFGRVERH